MTMPTKQAEEQPTGWRFEKRITFGDLITAITMFMLGLIAYFDVRERVSVVEMQQHVQERRDTEQDAAAARFSAEIRQDLRDIKGSIERIAERVGSRP